MTARERIRLDVGGAVQGVGFRPSVWRLARRCGLAGFVRNGSAGVVIEIEGEPERVEEFVEVLPKLPAPVLVESIRRSRCRPMGTRDFVIGDSIPDGPTALTLLPDLVVCADCIRELFDPGDRRHRYPFISCAICGPRYSIALALPWDRQRSTMRRFPLCPRCRDEYGDPADRRFHAETIACPDCGPEVELVAGKGSRLAGPDEAIELAAEHVAEGRILALKGLGGYQLICDARSEEAVARLRARKARPEKPLALLVPDLRAAAAIVRVDAAEAEALRSRAGPIVLMRRLADARVAEGVAPGLGHLGIMLPTTPLHHLLARALDRPLVATSGNLSGEPLFAIDAEALAGLADVADVFLRHDRDVHHPIDDSVVRLIDGEIATVRCARGLAPLRLPLDGDAGGLAAIGGDLKAAVAVGRDGEIVLGPYVGDLETPRAQDAIARGLGELGGLAGAEPRRIAVDSHPEWFAGRLARRLADDVVELGHHEAHALSVLVDNDALDAAALAVAWDGAGHGDDGTIWGGEFLAITGRRARRVGRLLPFRLPGADRAQREPRRALLAMLALVEGGDLGACPELAGSFRPEEVRVLSRMIAGLRLAPETSSAGRVFDGVAALLGLASLATYEGQAAMMLEARAIEAVDSDRDRALDPPAGLRCVWNDGALDWRPLVTGLRVERDRGRSMPLLAAWTHESLARGIRDAVTALAGRDRGLVALTGGCFQNALLAERAAALLREGGFRVLRHRRVPANDGGLAVGQIAAFVASRRRIHVPRHSGSPDRR